MSRLTFTYILGIEKEEKSIHTQLRDVGYTQEEKQESALPGSVLDLHQSFGDVYG